MPPYGGGRNNTISLQIILTDPTVVFITDHFSGLEPHIGPGAVMCPDSSVDYGGRLKTQVRKTKVPEDGICKYGIRKYEYARV